MFFHEIGFRNVSKMAINCGEIKKTCDVIRCFFYNFNFHIIVDFGKTKYAINCEFSNINQLKVNGDDEQKPKFCIETVAFSNLKSLKLK